MGLLPPHYLRPLHQLVEPSSDEVAALWPIRPEFSPCHLVCGQLPASTLIYLCQFHLVDQRLLSLRPRDVMLPGSPYQAHLHLRWEGVLAEMAPVTVVTTDKSISRINDDAFHGLCGPNFDLFGFFLVDSDWDY